MDGEFGCYQWRGKVALLNQRVCRLQNFAVGLYARFVYYGINSYLKAIEDVTGYATVKHLSSRQILNINFPVPPFSEQQRIVGILDEAFGGVETAKTNKGYENGAAQPNLGARSVAKYAIPLPTLAEQRKIVSKLDALREETQRLESIYQQKLAALEALKKSLLHQTFIGAL
jgi:restriction endonuclease S subunit